MEAMVGKTEEKAMEKGQERVRQLEEENRKLKKDNEILLNTVFRMRTTINRFIDRYVTE